MPPADVTLASIANVLGIKIGVEKSATPKSSVQELFESALGAGFKTGEKPEWLKKTKMW